MTSRDAGANADLTDRPKARETRILLLAGGVLLLVVLVFLRDAALMRGTFYTMDVAGQNFPIQHHFSSAVRSGKLPLWTSRLACGFPLYAEGQGALFYPLNLLFYVRPATVGLNLYIILHTFLAGLFLYWFARTTGISPWGALLAAMAYSLGALISRHHGILNHFGSLTWLPVPLALFNLWVARRRALWAVLGGLVLGVQWLAGHPQFSWLTHLALGLLLVFHLVRRELPSWRGKLAAVGAVAFMVAVGLGLGAVQLLPLHELTAFSERSAGVPYDKILGSGLAHEAYVDLLSPGYWGGAADATALADLEDVATLYVGIVPLLLAPFAFLRRPRGWCLALAILLGLGVFLSMRDSHIAAKVISWLPPANLFRYRLRHVIFFVIGLVLLAGRGLDVLLRERPSPSDRRRGRLPYLWLAALVLAGAAAAVCLHYVRDGVLPDPAEESLPAAVADAKLQAIRSVRSADLGHLIVFWGAGIVTLVLYFAGKIGRRALVALVAAQLAVNLLFFGVEKPPLISPDYYTRKPATLEVMSAEKAPFRVYGFWKYPKNPFDGEGFFTLSADNRVNYQYYVDLLTTDLSLLYDVDNASAFPHSLLLRRHMVLVEHVRQFVDAKVLGLMNVKYVLSVYPLDEPGLELIFDEDVRVYRNRFCLPRAFLVHDVVAVEGKSDVLPTLNVTDWQRTAVVEEWDSPVDLGGADAAPAGAATIVEYEDTHVAISVDTPRDALLVLADTNYPGWAAAVDGAPARIYQTNYLFRGVAVTAGTHRVTFDYRPASFRRGLAVSVASLFAVAVLLGASAWRAVRKRSRRPPAEAGGDDKSK